MTADLSALIARLEAAKEGSRELDGAIHRATSPDDLLMTDSGSVGRNPRPARRQPLRECDFVSDRDLADLMGSPSVTTSLDAAHALAERVFPDGRWMVERTHQGTGWAMFQPGEFAKIRAMVDAATPALALCAATLRAKLDGYEVNKNPKAQEG